MFETTIELTKPIGSNYTPAGLIIEWAKANKRRTSNSPYGGIRLHLGGIAFRYDHWSIADNGDGTETVTVFLISA